MDALGVAIVTQANIPVEECGQTGFGSANETGVLALSNRHSIGANDAREVRQGFYEEPCITLHALSTPLEVAAVSNHDDAYIDGTGGAVIVHEQRSSSYLDGCRESPAEAGPVEEYAQPIFRPGNETGVLALRRGHRIGLNDVGEVPQEALVEPGILISVHHTPLEPAAVCNRDNARGVRGGEETVLEQGLSLGLFGHREGPTEIGLVEDYAQPALQPGNEAGVLAGANSHNTGATDDREMHQGAYAEPNELPHPHPTPLEGLEAGIYDDTTRAGRGNGENFFGQGLDFDLDGHREGHTELRSASEAPSFPLLSHTVSLPGIMEGDGLFANNETTVKSQSFSKCASTAAEEGADGMNCPICMEPWTGEGVHRICCLACGHLFGRSCIRRWLNQRGKKNSKCPHCNRKARIEDIRNLYVPCLTVIDDKSQRLIEELQALRSKYEELVLQNEKYRKDCQNLQDMARSKEFFLAKHSPGILQENGIKRWNNVRSYNFGAKKSRKTFIIKDKNPAATNFELQEEFSLDGARVFDMDAYSQMLLVAQKSSASNGTFILNKISLLSLSDTLMMPLPPYTGAVRDIQVVPLSGKLPGRLALVASLGKMVSVFSLESNNVVLTYKLQSPCWSCAWDPNEPNYVFAGLQDGGLTLFDLRQTSSPLGCLQSFSRQPVHTVCPVSERELQQGKSKTAVLSACSSGIFFWDISILDGLNSRPQTIPCSNNSGTCVALAYNHLANVGIATFRDKPPAHQSEIMTQTTAATCQNPSIISSQLNSQEHVWQQPLRASHYPLAKNIHASALQPETHTAGGSGSCDNLSCMACEWRYGNPMFGNVSPVGMHRSAIVCSSCIESSSNPQLVFACGDEESHALMLWDVNTLSAIDRLKGHRSAILDVKSMNIGEQAILGCISATTLQVYKR